MLYSLCGIYPTVLQEILPDVHFYSDMFREPQEACIIGAVIILGSFNHKSILETNHSLLYKFFRLPYMALKVYI